jgi:polyisoprenoid-binding protein YceI
VTIEGTTVTAATIEADMTSITTNDSRRNDEVQSALETSTYPTATFILTSPIELGDAAASGQAVTVEATGELTIHGVTKTVTIPLQAQLVDGTVVLIGSTEIRFSDYGVSVPEAPIVLSASDTGTLELQLFLQR